MSKLSAFYRQNPDDVIAWQGERRISRAQFAAEVMRLAEVLPDTVYVINHCEDRYRFTVGLFAALVRGQVSLFPPSKVGQVIAQVVSQYPDVYCLSDKGEQYEGILSVDFPEPGQIAPDSSAIERLAFAADQVAAVAFTSGSTGQPRPYTKTWGGLALEAGAAGKAFGLEPGRGGHIVATVPPQHMYGLMASVMLPLQNSYTLGAEQPFYPEDIRDALERRDCPPVLITTPVHIRACVMEQTRMPATEFVLSSTGPLHAALAADAEKLFATVVKELYGSTETGAVATRRQAVGNAWTSFDEITVALTDDGFAISAPYFYESPMILTDNVEIISEHEFILHGRNTDLIKIAGKRMQLADLNHQLLSIEGVEDGTFFLPDPDAGGREGRLTAFVVAPGMTREQLMEALRQRVDPVFLPRPLHLIDAMPRNATGKLPRGNLVKLYERESTAG